MEYEKKILKEFQERIDALELPAPFDRMIKEVTPQIDREWSIDENKILTFPFDFQKRTWQEFRSDVLHELAHLLLGHPFYTPKNPLARYFYKMACEIEVSCFLKDKFGISVPDWLKGVIKKGWPSEGKLIKVQGKDAFQLTHELLESEEARLCFNEGTLRNQGFLRKAVF